MKDLFIDRSDSRTRIVKELGYSSYQKYLASPLWKQIKRNMFFWSGMECCACEGLATTVHHSKYTRENLSGENKVGLYAICERCHTAIHFDENRKKLSLAETHKRLKARMRA